MLRWTMPFLSHFSRSTPLPPRMARSTTKRAAYRAALQLPPGLPRAHYKYRTTVAPPAYRRGVVVVEEPELLFTPASDVVPYIPPRRRHAAAAGLLDASWLLRPPFSYDYHGPYYGGPYVPYWDRLPYACGVFGYC